MPGGSSGPNTLTKGGARVVEKSLDESVGVLLGAGSKHEASDGLQSGCFMWTYVRQSREAGKSSDAEAGMAADLALYLNTNGVEYDDILIVTFYKEQIDLLNKKLEHTKSAVDIHLTTPTPTAYPAFTHLIISIVSEDLLNHHLLEGNLSHLLMVAAQARATVVFLAPTIFVRTADPSHQPDKKETMWKEGWRGSIKRLKQHSFVVSGTKERITNIVSNELPLCCPRHPSVREEAEQGEGFPTNFCPYPCLSRFDECNTSNHVCVRTCHRGSHEKCIYGSNRRLPCGHMNKSLCSEPPDCGNSTTIDLECSHKEVVGWDELRLCIRYKEVKHKMVVPCGKDPKDMKCTTDTIIECGICGADRVVPCCDREEVKDQECPFCFAMKKAIWKKLKAAEIEAREAERVKKDQASLQLRLSQVEAAKKGIFVEGQRVAVTNADYAQSPEHFQTVFGDRTWLASGFKPPHGTQGIIRKRTSHPEDLGTLVYLVETQGQEFFIMVGKGLILHNVVAELQNAQHNVLMITAPEAPDLVPGEWRIYTPELRKDSPTIFNPTDFKDVADVIKIGGVDRFYTESNPPPSGRVFHVEKRMKHPDGSNVTVYLLSDIGRGTGSATMYVLSGPSVFRKPLQKGQKVLVTGPARLTKSRPFHMFFRDIPAGMWYDGPVHCNDSGVVVNIINDGTDHKCYYYLVKLDVMRMHAVFQYKGIELDEEAERMRRDDSMMFEKLDRMTLEEWDREKETARAVYKKQREANARFKEEAAATLNALHEAKRVKKGGMTAAERSQRDTELNRQREESQVKRKRLDREEEERTERDISTMKKRRVEKSKDSPWAEPTTDTTTAPPSATTPPVLPPLTDQPYEPAPFNPYGDQPPTTPPAQQYPYPYYPPYYYHQYSPHPSPGPAAQYPPYNPYAPGVQPSHPYQ
eukprot:TRINITY_DN8266_c0_g1_i2.p1 TRINITY_DN8266_c0_g1~~TRINITY_DN8266_c0_g1_i2.p1  ORF type:complete len:920 (+),score=174.63 TRINITY_DN8266_c0_g1_i2:462-3221(+)